MSYSTTIKCSVCAEVKPSTPEYFYFRKGKRVGLKCAACVRASQTEYRRSNPERIREQRRRYAEKNPETVAAGKRRWYDKNYVPKPRKRVTAEETARKNNERRRINRAKNPEREAEQYRLYSEKNRDAILAKKRERYRREAWVRVRASVSSRMQKTLKYGKDGTSWEALVGYTVADLVSHLEAQFCEGMSWENYRHDTWHIDHIRPVASFDITSPSDPDFRKCWALENLRPLWAWENRRKGAKWQKQPETFG